MFANLSPRKWEPIALLFLLICFTIGIATAIQVPVLSLYLTKEVKVKPLQVGLFFTVNALVGIVVSMFLATKSDHRGDRRKLITLCCLTAIAGALLFAFNRQYLVLMTLGVLLSSIASTALPQIFALAREYANHSVQELSFYSAMLRAQLSLAWVLGPPLAFMIALNAGFTTLFIIAAFLFLLCMLLVMRILPANTCTAEAVKERPTPLTRAQYINIILLFLMCVLIMTCNSMYIIDFPLYIHESLGLPEKLAGWLMGFAAGIEIPVMLVAGYILKHMTKRQLMLIALVAGTLFYCGMTLAETPITLALLHLFNALFIGIVGCVGMLWFQDLMPQKPGAATTLFSVTASTGMILAGALQGLAVEWVGHQSIYWISLLLTVLALLVCTRVKDHITA